MGQLANKTIVVTGGGRGIGRELALYLAQQGAAVVVNDLDQNLVADVAAHIHAGGGKALALAGSVADWTFAEQLMTTAVEHFGQLDGLVNNAGLHYVSQPWEETEQQVCRLVEVNLLGTLYCGIHALKRLTGQGRGTIVNVTSGAHLGVEGQASYSATKGAVASLTYSWARDAMPYGVRVNAVAPLAVTRMLDNLPQFKTTPATPDTSADDSGPLVMPPEALAPVFGYLLSDHSSGITGQIVRFTGRDLSLIRHPRSPGEHQQRQSWDIDSIAQTFQSDFAQQLEPVGLGATEYVWQPQNQ